MYLIDHIRTRHVISNLHSPKNTLANFNIIIANTVNQNVTAVFNTGETCSCILKQLYNRITSPEVPKIRPIKFFPIKVQVNQADGQTSLEPVSLALITVQLQNTCLPTLS